jgi:cystathionine beta-lyase
MGIGSSYDQDSNFATKAIHCYDPNVEKEHAINPPIYYTSTFSQRPDEKQNFIYSRVQNPTKQLLEKQITVLEEGAQTIVLSSASACMALLY